MLVVSKVLRIFGKIDCSDQLATTWMKHFLSAAFFDTSKIATRLYRVAGQAAGFQVRIFASSPFEIAVVPTARATPDRFSSLA